MPRVKRGTKRRARRKKLLKHAKGFFLTKGKLYRSAKEAVNRSLRYTYRDRRVRKRDYRALWIQRIGAAARNNGTTYSQLIHGAEGRRHRSGPQDSGGHGRARCRRIRVAGRLGEAALPEAAAQACKPRGPRLFATTKKANCHAMRSVRIGGWRDFTSAGRFARSRCRGVSSP